MSKRAAAQRADVEAPPKKSKKEKVPDDEARTEETKKKKQELSALRLQLRRQLEEDAEGAAGATLEAPVEATLEAPAEEWRLRCGRKRKEEKKKRKQAAAEEAVAAEEQGKEAPKKKTKTESAVAVKETAVFDAETPQKQGATSASASGNEFMIVVRGLSLICTEEALRKYFSECGEIESLKVPGKKKSGGIAFITYTCKEDVEKALKLNASEYEGCALRVNLSGKEADENSNALQVFVGGLPIQPDAATLRQHFGDCGEISSFLMPLSAKNCPKGIAYISFTTRKAVNKALVLDGTDHGGRTITVNKADEETALKVNKTPQKEIEEKQVKAPALKVFVGGLPVEVDETTLKKTFDKCGEIASLKKIVPSNPEKKLKQGIVFITYKTQEGFDKALKFNGAQYEGCRLTVKHAGDGKAKVKDIKDNNSKGKGKGSKGKGKESEAKGKGKARKEKTGQSVGAPK